MTLLCRASSSPIDETSLQDIAYSLQLSQEGNPNDSRLMQLASLVDLARRTGEDLDDGDSPFKARLLELLREQELLANKDKKANYMSLCHFKICNMGRKRTQWSIWPRT